MWAINNGHSMVIRMMDGIRTFDASIITFNRLTLGANEINRTDRGNM